MQVFDLTAHIEAQKESWSDWQHWMKYLHGANDNGTL